jgi:hypothetical protein
MTICNTVPAASAGCDHCTYVTDLHPPLHHKQPGVDCLQQSLTLFTLPSTTPPTCLVRLLRPKGTWRWVQATVREVRLVQLPIQSGRDGNTRWRSLSRDPVKTSAMRGCNGLRLTRILNTSSAHEHLQVCRQLCRPHLNQAGHNAASIDGTFYSWKSCC